jgi:hypothetical protein
MSSGSPPDPGLAAKTYNDDRRVRKTQPSQMALTRAGRGTPKTNSPPVTARTLARCSDKTLCEREDDGMRKIVVVNCFGGCPECGANDGCLTNPGQNWFRCDGHKTKWTPGHIFNWKASDEKQSRENFARLEGYADMSDDALPEGVWSTDPVIRATEIDN